MARGRVSTSCAPLVALLTALLAAPAGAEESFLPEAPDVASLELLASTLRVNRQAMVAVNLPLEEHEAEKFWPLYVSFSSETSRVRERLAVLVDEYIAIFDTMTQEDASRLLEAYLDVESDYADVRRRWRGRFVEALPPRKAVRLYQIENKIDAVLRYHAARSIPVIAK